MASYQKFSNLSIVPWYNSEEWRSVYKLIYKDNASKDEWKRAIDIIGLWQMRSPLLPSGVEGTLCILEALVVDVASLPERQYQILCASSVMRFLNICVASRATVHNFTRTAKEHSIPDWIIGIRHDFAHSQQLPGVALLQYALKEAFCWLQHTYWIPENTIINDYIITNDTAARQDIQSHELFSLFAYLFIYDVRGYSHDEFFQRILYSANFKRICSETQFYPKVLLTTLANNSDNMKILQWRKCFEEMMKTRWFTITPTTLYKNATSCKEQFLTFSQLISLIEKQQKLVMLVEELIYIVQDEHELARKEASMWMNEIFKGVLKCRCKKRLNEVSGFGIVFNQIRNSTVSDLLVLKPKLLRIPETFRSLFIKSYLLMQDINIDLNCAVKEISKMTLVYGDGEALEDTWKLKELEDVYNSQLESLLPDRESPLTSESCVHANIASRWTLVTDTNAFESIAIGVLPQFSFE